MIARNEEELLPLAVSSTQGLADEIVVVDTGSEDNTIQVAKTLADKVLVGADRMNKSQARNRAIMAATGDWVVILDCDEQIADPIGVREFLETTDVEAVYIRLTYMSGDQGTLSYSQMRAWKRGKYVYKYRAHEVPVPTKGWTKIAHTDFVWEHRPPPDRTWKSTYTLERLILDVAENPGEARPLYYLGRQYSYRQEWKLGLETLQKYLECPGRDGADAWRVLAKCHAGLGEEREQIIALYNACAREPDRREFWGELATIHHKKGEDDLAAGLLKCALEMPMPATAYMSHYWHGSAIYDLLARCLWKLERYEEGHEYALHAVDLSPEDERLQKNLMWFERKLHDGQDTHYMQIGSQFQRGLAVLYLAYQDYGGVARKMADALNATNRHRARVVTYETTYLRYGTDYLRPTELELEELLRWADIIHVMDFIPKNVARFGKPIVVTYNGKHFRQDPDKANAIASRLGIAAQMCTTLDLTQFGAQWIPVPMKSLPQAEPYDGGIFRVVHAPTRRDKKNTAEVIEQLGNLDGIELDIIERVANSVCLARKQRAHLLVDQFMLGYGINALEAWSIGLPVVANATGTAMECIIGEIGSELPFVSSTVQNLRETVLLLQRNPQLYAKARARGMDYLARYHDPVKVASHLISVYTKALSQHRRHDEAEKMNAFYRQFGPEVHVRYGRERYKIIAGLVEGPNVLDVGCGTGDLLLKLQDISPEWTLGGVDISTVALQMAQDRGFTGELQQALFGSEWNTIVLSQVLEHLDDDVAMVSAAAARLDEEGRLIVTVPAGDRIPSPHHKREYTEDTLTELLAPFGQVTFHPLDEYRLLVTVEKVRRKECQ
jgi:tetratricopeptide (TPR) repeat protein